MSSIGLSFSERLADERPRSLTSAVQERLRADILSTRLLPGQKLHIAGLAKQFSVSLAAVREALSRLVADGLVQASDQRGFRVSPVSPADLRDVTQTRVDIEGLALRRSIERGDQEWLCIGGAVFHGALRCSLHLSGRPHSSLRGMGGASPCLSPHAGERLRLAMAARLSRRAARAERTLSKALDPARHREITQRRGRTRRHRARRAQARCRRRRRGAFERTSRRPCIWSSSQHPTISGGGGTV